MVFTTFLIPFGSGMVVTNVVWYWYEFDCLIPEGPRDMRSYRYSQDMGSCERERSSLLIFASRGSAPRCSHSTVRSPNAAMGSASGTPPSSSRSHTAGPVRSPAHTGEMGVLSTIGERRAQPAAGSLCTCIFVRREAPWQWHCNSCGMRMDHACRQAMPCWHT